MNAVRLYDIRSTEPSSCVRCRRVLQKIDRRYDQPQLEPDACGFCAVPLTDRAKAKRRPVGVETKAMVFG